MKWLFKKKAINAILFLLLTCLVTSCIYTKLFDTPLGPSSGPIATGEGLLPKKIGFLLLNLKGQSSLYYGLEEEAYKDAVRQIREAIQRQGFELAEEAPIYKYFSYEVSTKDWDVTYSLTTDKAKEMLNIDAALIGYYGLGKDNNPQLPKVLLATVNEGCYGRMKLIDIVSRKTLWSAEGDGYAWTRKAAIRKTIEELLEQFERDVSKIKGRKQ
jgi:hypothetical protein